jgi:hypothetical protein
MHQVQFQPIPISILGLELVRIGIFMKLENFEKPTIDSDSSTLKTFSQVL